jgi:mRNA-degrading endonuclease RelE of RelBE toxin-antitoxin system
MINMNTIEWMPKAKRQANKIKSAVDRLDVIDGVDTLHNFPNVSGVKHLTNSPIPYRLRVGNWRILFDFDGTAHIISIEEVKKRNERTY